PPYRMLLKLPLSMFAPAALLPFWFALLQVGVVYVLAQSLLGTRRTVLVAVAGHVLATVSAHVWVAMGPPIGGAHRYAHVGGAGPSAAGGARLAAGGGASRRGWRAAGMIVSPPMGTGVFAGLARRDPLVGPLTGVALAALPRHAGRHPTVRPG